MPDTVEIGLGRSARRGYHLDEVALVPTRRTRGASVVSTSWQIDANSFDLPLVAAPSDAVVSPETAVLIGRLGGLAVLDGEGLWTRHEDAGDRIAELGRGDLDTRMLQAAYATPVSPDLLRRRIGELRATGEVIAVRLSPQHTVELAPHVLAAGVDLLIVQGTVISAEHVGSTQDEKASGTALNLKTFTAEVDVPIVVGGCTNYQTALHLMRTGAAGVIIGYGAHVGSTTHSALVTGGDIPKALGCGADAVMLGDALATAAEAPGAGWYWDTTAAHPRVPRSAVVRLPRGDAAAPSLEEVVVGPTSDPSGQRNLFGALRRVMGKCGYSSVKEFQKAELILTGRT